MRNYIDLTGNHWFEEDDFCEEDLVPFEEDDELSIKKGNCNGHIIIIEEEYAYDDE